MKARLLALLILGTAAAAGAADVATTAKQPAASARAYGIAMVVPGQAGAGAAEAIAPGDASTGFADAFLYPADGSLVRTGALSSSVSARATAAPAAHAVTDVLTGSLFNGEITFESAAGRAKSDPDGTDAGGSAVTGLTVLGQGIEATPNQRYPIGDWGFLVTLEQAVEARAEGSGDARVSVTALHVTLTAEHAGLPAGTEILIGHGEAATSVPKVEAIDRKTTPTKTVPQKPSEPAQAAPRRPRPPPLPRPPEPLPGLRLPGPIFRPPPDISVRLSPAGYVFPMYGNASYSDTYGAPRATTGWHHGTDIFAPLGAPVLAVANGTLFSIGWNDVGGFRLWLRDRQGNQFYYAHLAAYSAIAANGAEVRAGQVIGFNGNTGDAQGTPYHLHFEIHPVSLLAMGYDGSINPTSFLDAVRRLQDVSLVVGRGWAPPVPASAQAPRPGAFLLGASDISSASGLEPGSLQRALVAPASAEGDGALLQSG